MPADPIGRAWTYLTVTGLSSLIFPLFPAGSSKKKAHSAEYDPPYRSATVPASFTRRKSHGAPKLTQNPTTVYRMNLNT